MGPHATWFDFIPGYPGFRSGLQESLGRTWTWQVFQATHFQLDHVMCALVVLAFLALGAFRYATAVGGSGDAGLVPPPKLGMRNVFEVLADTVLGLMAGVIGEKAAKKYLPLVGTLFLFILFSNLLGLIPGFLPPTVHAEDQPGDVGAGVSPQPRVTACASTASSTSSTSWDRSGGWRR